MGIQFMPIASYEKKYGGLGNENKSGIKSLSSMSCTLLHTHLVKI